jgi:hypothetical protein
MEWWRELVICHWSMGRSQGGAKSRERRGKSGESGAGVEYGVMVGAGCLLTAGARGAEVLRSASLGERLDRLSRVADM